jgi:hypothetical protein
MLPYVRKLFHSRSMVGWGGIIYSGLAYGTGQFPNTLVANAARYKQSNKRDEWI